MGSTSERLRNAIDVVRQRQIKKGKGPRVTAKAICEEAGVSRSLIYKGYPEVLEILRATNNSGSKLGRHAVLARKVQKFRKQTLEQKRMIAALTKMCFDLKLVLDRLKRKREREVASLEREIRQLRSENSSLLKQVSAVVGIRPMKNELKNTQD